MGRALEGAGRWYYGTRRDGERLVELSLQPGDASGGRDRRHERLVVSGAEVIHLACSAIENHIP